MPKTLVDIDEDLLREVSAALGTRTKKDTVNEALREVAALHARRRDLEWLRSGRLDGIAEPAARAAAWQR